MAKKKVAKKAPAAKKVAKKPQEGCCQEEDCEEAGQDGMQELLQVIARSPRSIQAAEIRTDYNEEGPPGVSSPAALSVE